MSWRKAIPFDHGLQDLVDPGGAGDASFKAGMAFSLRYVVDWSADRIADSLCLPLAALGTIPDVICMRHSGWNGRIAARHVSWIQHRAICTHSLCG